MLTMPLLFALRNRAPTAYIGWVIGEAASPLLEALPQLDCVHVWKNRDREPFGLLRLARELRSKHYEVSIDPQGLAKSAILPILAGIRERVGFEHSHVESREMAALLINRRVSPPADCVNVVSRNLYLGTRLGLDMPRQMPIEFPHDLQAETRMGQWWRQQGLISPTIIFGLGAGFRTKLWSIREMAALVRVARDSGFGCAFLWGPREERRVREWQNVLGENVVWPPRMSIREMVAFIRLCDRYAGPDSFALHTASALGKPTFSWYGPSDPARCAPQGPRHRFIAKGPHTYNRLWFTPTGLQTLKADEVVPTFQDWLRRQ